MILSLTESKENRYSYAFQDFHGIAIHNDQYEVFSRHPGASGRHAGFVRTTIGVSNCENRWVVAFTMDLITTALYHIFIGPLISSVVEIESAISFLVRVLIQ